MYVNLHAHTTFSVSDGHATVTEYVDRISSMGHDAVAITDHGMMGALPDLWAACGDAILPIAGCEVYTTPYDIGFRPEGWTREERKGFDQSSHLTLLAMNATGYRNLMALSSAGWRDGYAGFPTRPRVDHALLVQHHDGIICLSGCGSSELSRAILDSDDALIDALLEFYRATYPDRFFLELQNHGNYFPQQQQINRQLLYLARKHGLPVVATNDSHFCAAHHAIGQRRLLDASDSTKFYKASPYTYVRDNHEMMQAFGDSALLRNTIAISRMCERYPLGDKVPKLPIAPLAINPRNPAQEGRERLAELVRGGLGHRLGTMNWSAIPAAYKERAEYELGVVEQMSRQLQVPFEYYLLTYADVCRHARRIDLPYAARGSAAGSLLLWALGVTQIDPLQHGLYFERFLNPERVALPDVDVDFSDERRHEIFSYIKETYGDAHVCKIGTYSQIKAKGAIWSAARALDYRGELTRHPLDLGRELSGLVTDETDSFYTDESQLLRRCAVDPNAKKVVETAQMLLGRFASSGTHAAGVIIADRPVHEVVPLMRCNDPDIPMQTQYEMAHLEKLGLLKLDVLGLSELTKIERCLRIVTQQTGQRIDLWQLPLDDQAVWDLICSGDTLGIFQLGGVADTAVTAIQPRTIADLALVSAIIRPGPADHLEVVAERKHGRMPVRSLHPSLTAILAETYGEPIYQEQVIAILVEVAEFSRGEADNVRKAMGKKDAGELARWHDRFVQGALDKGYTEQDITRIWSYIEPFAGYGFNKAHAYSYAYLGWHGAWLKTHFPQAFYAAAMTVDRDNPDKIGLFAAEAARRGIRLLPPDVNRSGIYFEPDGTDIRYGLAAIKGVGESAAQDIIDHQPYLDLLDLIRRSPANKKVLDHLAQVGALPWGERAAIRESLDPLVKLRKHLIPTTRRNESPDQALRRTSERADHEFYMAALQPWPSVDPMDTVSKLIAESDAMGITVTAFPRLSGVPVDTSIAKLGHLANQDKIWIAGMLTQLKPFVAKKSNKLMARARILDETGAIDLLIFPHVWEKLSEWATNGTLVCLMGKPEYEKHGGEDALFVPAPSQMTFLVQHGYELQIQGGLSLTRTNTRSDDATCTAPVPTAVPAVADHAAKGLR